MIHDRYQITVYPLICYKWIFIPINGDINPYSFGIYILFLSARQRAFRNHFIMGNSKYNPSLRIYLKINGIAFLSIIKERHDHWEQLENIKITHNLIQLRWLCQNVDDFPSQCFFRNSMFMLHAYTVLHTLEENQSLPLLQQLIRIQ